MSERKRKDTELGRIPEDWEIISIEDIGDVIGGGTPSTSNISNFEGDIPWLTPKDLSNYEDKYIGKGERNISEEGLKNSSAKLMPKGTVLLTSRAPVGYVAIASNELSTNQGFKSIIPKENIDSDFLYYLLKLNKEYIESHASGSTFKEISGSTLKKLKFPMPPLNEQKKIAIILSHLDEKINTLREQNKTLEKIGKTIFNERFVNFRFPGNERFIEESEIGLIPKGWTLKRFGELADICSGKRPDKKSLKLTEDSNIPIIGANGVTGYTNKALYNEKVIIIGRVGTHGTVSRYYNNIRPSDNTLVIKSNFYEYVYQILLQIDYSSLNKGAVQPLITQSDMNKNIVLMPPIELLLEFERISNGLFEKINLNNLKLQSLSNLYDITLPRLISGKMYI